jgi:hypothetical protein
MKTLVPFLHLSLILCGLCYYLEGLSYFEGIGNDFSDLIVDKVIFENSHYPPLFVVF